RSSVAPWSSRRAPLMSGWMRQGSARSHIAPAASPASSWRVSAATGQWSGSRRTWRRSCACRPSSRPVATSARPSATATSADGAPSRRAAGSSRVALDTGASAAVADVDDLVLAGAGGRFDRDAVAGVLADHRPRHRRRDRDQPELDVRFQVAHDLVTLFLVGLDIGDRDRRAEHDPVADVELAHVDDVGMGKLALQLLDATFDEALLLARGVVLGVLLEVAVGPRLGNGGDHRRPLHRLEFIEFGA